MNNYFTDYTLNLEALPSEAIALEPASIQQAIELSQQIPDREQKWQTYLNLLAIFSFQNWLKQRLPFHHIDWEESFTIPPDNSIFMGNGGYLKLGKFIFFVLVMGSLTEESIELSKFVIDGFQSRIDFYVLVEVMEELEEGTILGFLEGDRLLKIISNKQLEVDKNENYIINLSYFENNLDDLLLYLRFLEPTTIPLSNFPEIPIVSQFIEQTTNLRITAVNVWYWLQNELDEFAAQLSWILLPTLSTERFRGMNTLGEVIGSEAINQRSPLEELDAIITQLQRRETQIPSGARGAYQNLQIASISLRLYVVTWSLVSVENIPEWKLLLILGSTASSNLPEGTKLAVSDNIDLLVEEVANTADVPYLYARVAGTWEEEFNITIGLKNGETLALAPFTFNPS